MVLESDMYATVAGRQAVLISKSVPGDFTPLYIKCTAEDIRDLVFPSPKRFDISIRYLVSFPISNIRATISINPIRSKACADHQEGFDPRRRFALLKLLPPSSSQSPPLPPLLTPTWTRAATPSASPPTPPTPKAPS